MTDRPDPNAEDLDAIARRVRDLPPVEAEPAFRSALREAFVSGEVAPAGRRSDAITQSRAWWLGWRVLAPLAAAMIVVALFTVLGPGPMRVLDVEGTGTVRVDGRDFAAAGRESLIRAIHGGADVEVGDGVTLDLLVPRVALYELTAGTRMTLPAPPSRWAGHAAACSLLTGEMRLKTGSRFHGNRLTVYTPRGLVIVRGTLLSIAVDEEGTCICVLEGVASVGVDADHLEDVQPGFRKIMLANGETSVVPVKPMHRDGVLKFEALHGEAVD
jgi:hypothetical protein